MMRALPAPDPRLLIVTAWGCYRDLWDKITFTELIQLDQASQPFLLNGCVWSIALWRREEDRR